MSKKTRRKSSNLSIINQPLKNEIISLPTDEAVRRTIVNRFWRMLNLISISIYLFLVYGSSVILDYALFSVIQYTMGSEIQKYPFVALIVSYTQIGLALLALLAFIVHSVFSTYGQMQLDRSVLREGEVYYDKK